MTKRSYSNLSPVSFSLFSSCYAYLYSNRNSDEPTPPVTPAREYSFIVSGEDIDEDLVGEEAQIADKASWSYLDLVRSAFWLAFCASTAIQPSLNSMAVGDYLSTGYKCDVGELDCYLEPRGDVPGLNLAFGIMGLLANTAIAYVFLPSVYDTFIKIYMSRSKCATSIGGATLFACAAAAVSYQLSRDSFKLGDNQVFWSAINILLIFLSVVVTFASRFRGSHQMLNKAWRIIPQIDAFFSYLYITDNNLAWAITAQNDLLRSVYSMPNSVLKTIARSLDNRDFSTAMSLLYNGSHNRKGADKWSGIAVTPARSAVYWGLQAVFFTLSLFSSCIIYNVISKFTQGWDKGVAQAATMLFTLPATLYYLYSLCRLPDAAFRAHALAYQKNEARIWLLYGVVYTIALGSCGNLLYSGMTQGLDGEFEWMGLPSQSAKIFFGVVGAAISSLCNLFALLDIFEKNVTVNSELKKVVDTCDKGMSACVQECRESDNTQVSHDVENPIQGSEQVSTLPLIAAPAGKEEIAIIKKFYTAVRLNFGIFPRAVAGEQNFAPTCGRG